MPGAVAVNILAKVTAGLANVVEDVYQYPAAIISPTAMGMFCGEVRNKPRIAANSAKVAINSPSHWPVPERVVSLI